MLGCLLHAMLGSAGDGTDVPLRTITPAEIPSRVTHRRFVVIATGVGRTTQGDDCASKLQLPVATFEAFRAKTVVVQTVVHEPGYAHVEGISSRASRERHHYRHNWKAERTQSLNERVGGRVRSIGDERREDGTLGACVDLRFYKPAKDTCLAFTVLHAGDGDER